MRDFVTEVEAKKKSCPFMAADMDEGVAQAQECLGSNCMAWRWSHQDTGPAEAPTGFCGAAGLPKYI